MVDEPVPPAEPTPEPAESPPPTAAPELAPSPSPEIPAEIPAEPEPAVALTTPEPSPSTSVAPDEQLLEQEVPDATATDAVEVAQPPEPSAAPESPQVVSSSVSRESSAPVARDEQPRQARISWSDAHRKAAAAEHTRRKEARLEKVVRLVRTRGRIIKGEIVRKLHVSDASASRYAKILVERGVLRREGKGRGVSHVLL